jgi:hypothetical protein
VQCRDAERKHRGVGRVRRRGGSKRVRKPLRGRREPKRGKSSRAYGTIGAFRSQRLAVNNLNQGFDLKFREHGQVLDALGVHEAGLTRP